MTHPIGSTVIVKPLKREGVVMTLAVTWRGRSYRVCTVDDNGLERERWYGEAELAGKGKEE